ncbi:MAG: hypothetical protein RIG62_30540 [Cyclobacteriaceae bacterium]
MLDSCFHRFKINWILIPLVFLLSCDCYRTAEGIIIEEDTGLPINNVQIVNDNDYERKETNHLEMSDTEGRFSYSDISGGLFGCPDLTLVFSKQGYNNFRMTFDSSSKFDTIYFEKIK